ncbi:MAG: TolB family protein [Planctomycetota bacterium]
MSQRWMHLGVLGLVLGGAAPAQVTQKVSVSTSGAAGNPGSTTPWISADGRFVAFHSAATNLVAGDTNAVHDSFLRDRLLGTTERVSVNTAETEGNAASQFPSASADGRYVAFQSPSSNLVGGDSNGSDDVFVRDRLNGTTERVSVSTGGAQATTHSRASSISADGRFVAFESFASNLVANDTNASRDVFLRDRQLGTTERVSVATGGAQGDGESSASCISADGRFVAFQSFATNLVAGDTGSWDIFVRDLQLGTTERVSVATGGLQGNSNSFEPALSADGRYVAFRSDATNLVANDTNGVMDVFVHDRQSGTTGRVSVATDGTQASALCQNPSISDDGRFAGFESSAGNLVAGDTNLLADSFVHDRFAGTTERASLTHAGAQGNSSSWFASLSGDGRYVAFYSIASNLVPGDVNGGADVFVRDRVGGTNFTSLCDPGLGGVIACPCANPPSGPGRGCDNSAATGGAILTAAGGAYLSSDTLVFTTSGERPTSLSIMAQWNGFDATGVVFGQGVRCTSGTFKRLYSKSASGGSITVPDFGAGELSVSARSAALGDVLVAGASRWHFVFYRDPNVLGGCPPLGTFNATQTGQVIWAP